MAAPIPSLLGQVVELEVGPVAHGGHCVARVGAEPGRVVFVRHTLPGERVRALVTEDRGKSFCRADAIEILRAAAGRVDPPCRFAGPARCGGCDWQHVDPTVQRGLKTAVVIEALERIGGLAGDPVVRSVDVQPLPGGPLGWRVRTRYAVDAQGRVGLHRHRSTEVETVSVCVIGAAGVGDAPELGRRWVGTTGVEVVTNGTDRSVFASRPTATSAKRAADRTRSRRGRGPGHSSDTAERVELVSGPPVLPRHVHGHEYAVAARGFWQGHVAAPDVYVGVVLDALALRPGDVVLDLYAGAGLFTVALAAAVGPSGTVRALEGDARAVEDARGNLVGFPWASVERAPVTAGSIAGLGPANLIVLDPPRTGAGREVMAAVLAAGARAVAYVACDPAAFARDVRTATEAGWRLTRLEAFDAFPMTHHVECVGVLVPDGPTVF